MYAARGNKWRPRYKVPQGGGPSLKGRDPRAKKKGRGLWVGREAEGLSTKRAERLRLKAKAVKDMKEGRP